MFLRPKKKWVARHIKRGVNYQQNLFTTHTPQEPFITWTGKWVGEGRNNITSQREEASDLDGTQVIAGGQKEIREISGLGYMQNEKKRMGQFLLLSLFISKALVGV